MNLLFRLPLLSKESIHDLATWIDQSADGAYEGVKMVDVLPYLGMEEKRDLALKRALDKRDISDFFPYLGPDNLRLIVKATTEQGILLSKAQEAMPFLPKDSVELIIRTFFKGVDSLNSIETKAILPYARPSFRDAYFRHVLHDKTRDPWVYGPFLSAKGLHLLAIDYCNDTLPASFDVARGITFWKGRDNEMVRVHFENKKKKAKKEAAAKREEAKKKAPRESK